MLGPKDVKVVHKTANSTLSQSWETYWFEVDGRKSFGIEKQDGVFKFFAKHCKNLDSAKQYIDDFINSGNKLQAI